MRQKAERRGSKVSWQGGLKALITVGAMSALMGCATSSMKHVQAVDSSEKTVKFLYSQYVNAEVGYKRGVIECELVEQDLVNCRELQMEYR